MMPYSGRLRALWRGRPIFIVGFDATHALCVVDGELQYIDHKDLHVTWEGDDEAFVWRQLGGTYEEADDSVSGGDAVDADDTDEGDAR
jgi:hypothetical protein